MPVSIFIVSGVHQAQPHGVQVCVAVDVNSLSMCVCVLVAAAGRSAFARAATTLRRAHSEGAPLRGAVKTAEETGSRAQVMRACMHRVLS